MPRPKPVQKKSRAISSSSRLSSSSKSHDGAPPASSRTNSETTPLLTAPKPRLKHNKLIRRFHTLMKELDALKGSQKATPTGQERIKAIEAEMDSLGGLERYQKASLIGQKGSKGGENSGKWFVEHLEDMFSLTSLSQPLRLLDVGCLCPSTHYTSCRWIDLTAIDLNPQSLGVTRADFLTMPVPSQPFDVVAMSLVVNFVGDPVKRGELLSRSRLFLRPPSDSSQSPHSLLYLVLPLSCVANSRYLTHELFVDMMSYLGFDLERYYFSGSKGDASLTIGRLAYYIFSLRRFGRTSDDAKDADDGRRVNEKRKRKPEGNTDIPAFPKKLIKPGPARNNFTIVL